MPDGAAPPTTELVVRLGTPEDIDDVMALAQLAADENALVVSSVTRVLEVIWPALHKEGGLVGLVGPRDGKPQGFALLRVYKPWYSDERLIEECVVYVHADWRKIKGGRAAMLYRFCKQVADQLRCKLIIGVLSRHRADSKIRYYERFFGEQAGAYFIYDPQANAGAAPGG